MTQPPPVASAKQRSLLTLEGLMPDTGFAARVRLPVWGNTPQAPRASTLVLFEDGAELGPAHAAIGHVRAKGQGRYQHRRNVLFLSSSDGSDPCGNGRLYQALVGGPERPITPATLAIDQLRRLPAAFSPSQAWGAIERVASHLYPSAILGPHAKTFFREDAFRAEYLRLCGPKLQMMERKFTVYQLVQAVHDIPGDIAECGCNKGATAYFMALAARRSGRERPMHLFDSFEGLSQPGAKDGTAWTAGALAATEAELAASLAGFGNVSVYRGWIPERFAEVSSRRFCFVHIDVDLYQPTRDSIAFFYDRLEPGGIMLCDDYGSLFCPGARVAMDEFFRDRPEYVVDLPTEQGFIIKR